MLSIPVGPTSLDLPAWVQAVGTVVAIAASVWISHSDGRVRKAERAKDRAEQRKLKKEELLERKRVRQEDHQARSRDHYCFVQYVYDQLNSADSTIYKQWEKAKSKWDDPSLNKEGFDTLSAINSLINEVERLAFEPLLKTRVLPYHYWINPQIAGEFVEVLDSLEITLERIKRKYLTPKRIINPDTELERYASFLACGGDSGLFESDLNDVMFRWTAKAHLRAAMEAGINTYYVGREKALAEIKKRDEYGDRLDIEYTEAMKNHRVHEFMNNDLTKM